jgi:glutamate:GABA antiporter
VPAALVIAELGAAFPYQGGPYVWARLAFGRYAGTLVANFLGFELPSTASDELRDPARDVPTSIVRAGWMTCALYAVPVLAIVLVVPPEQLTGLTRFVKALAGVFVVYGSWAGPVAAVAAAAFIGVLIANGLTWTMGASRTQVAAGRDGIGPAALAGVSARTGTPVAATLLGGAVATATTLAAFAVGGDDNARYFSVVLALSISLLNPANLVVLPALIRLRRLHPGQPRPSVSREVRPGRRSPVGWPPAGRRWRCWPCCGPGSPPPRPTPISRTASPATAPASC